MSEGHGTLGHGHQSDDVSQKYSLEQRLQAIKAYSVYAHAFKEQIGDEFWERDYYIILTEVYRTHFLKGRLSVKAAAAIVNLQGNTLDTRLDKLEEAQYISRKKDDKDGRLRIYFQLTNL